jgi:hypothetical protein
MAGYDKIVRNLTDGALTIRDGTASPNTVTVDIDEGDVAITVHKERRIITHRGTIHHIRPGNQVPVDVAFTMQFSEFETATTCTPFEILTKTNNASAYLGTRSNGVVDGAEDYTTLLLFSITDPGGGAAEVITIDHFAVEEISFNEGEDYSTLAVSGRALITIPAIAKV